MALCNTEKTYGMVSKLLHWLIAIMILGLLAVGVAFNYISSDMEKILMPYHKSAGVTVLILMVLRLFWRLANPSPRLPKKMLLWEKSLAKLVHYLFYGVVIAMPISGIVMTLAAGYPLPFWNFGNIHLAFIPLDKALSGLMFSWHNYLAWTIFVLFVLHTVAALKHHFINKDDVLTRMM